MLGRAILNQHCLLGTSLQPPLSYVSTLPLHECQHQTIQFGDGYSFVLIQRLLTVANTDLDILGKSAINGTTENSSTTAIPKAKNSELQEVFECAYRWSEEYSKRILLNIRKTQSARENNQRRYENDKIQAKASRFSPYNEIGARFAQKDVDLDHQLRSSEENCLHELERLVSRLTSAKHATKPVTTAAQDQTIATLEAKMTEISQIASKQAEQLQGLLKVDERSRQTMASLERSFDSIKTEHESLKDAYNSLKSDRDSLESRVNTLDQSLQSLLSQQVKTENENKSLKQQLRNIQTGADKALEARLLKLAQKSTPPVSQAELTQGKMDLAALETKLNNIDTSRKRVEAGLGEQIKNMEADFHERMRGVETGLGERIENIQRGFNEQIGGVNSKLKDFDDYEDIKEKLDELDIVTLNEVCEAWVSSDYNLKTQYDEYRDRHRQVNSSSDADGQLPHEGADLQPTDQVNANTTLSSEQIEAIVTAKVTAEIGAVEKSINEKTKKFCEQKDGVLAEIIEDGLARIATLEAAGASSSKLEARIQLLEQWKAATTWLDQKEASNIAERLGLLEGKSSGPRMDRIELEVSELSRKLDTIKIEVGQLVKREWVELRLQEALTGVTTGPGLLVQVKDLQAQIPALDQAIKVLDSQFQNLSTKQLAEHISRLINTSVEQRLAKLEAKASQLEGKASNTDKQVYQNLESLHQIHDLLERLTGGKKRTASPNIQDEMNKRRRLDVNGRHPSPLQQQQQQQIPPPQQPAQQPPHRHFNIRPSPS